MKYREMHMFGVFRKSGVPFGILPQEQYIKQTDPLCMNYIEFGQVKVSSVVVVAAVKEGGNAYIQGVKKNDYCFRFSPTADGPFEPITMEEMKLAETITVGRIVENEIPIPVPDKHVRISVGPVSLTVVSWNIGKFPFIHNQDDKDSHAQEQIIQIFPRSNQDVARREDTWICLSYVSKEDRTLLREGDIILNFGDSLPHTQQTLDNYKKLCRQRKTPVVLVFARSRRTQAAFVENQALKAARCAAEKAAYEASDLGRMFKALDKIDTRVSSYGYNLKDVNLKDVKKVFICAYKQIVQRANVGAVSGEIALQQLRQENHPEIAAMMEQIEEILKDDWKMGFAIAGWEGGLLKLRMTRPRNCCDDGTD